MKRALVSLLVLGLMAGCSAVPTVAPGISPAAGTTAVKPMVPEQALQLTAKTAITLTSIAHGSMLAAAVNMLYDPLAPNWEIEESRLSDDTYFFSMKMKRYHTGGAGESAQILKRRAAQLQMEQGYAQYHLMAYTEGIDSQTFGSRRVAEGTVKLVQKQQADSFQLNDRN